MQYYQAIGNVRGACNHHHKTAQTAQKCADLDQAGCKTQGGYSDRYVHLIIDGQDAGPVEM